MEIFGNGQDINRPLLYSKEVIFSPKKKCICGDCINQEDGVITVMKRTLKDNLTKENQDPIFEKHLVKIHAKFGNGKLTLKNLRSKRKNGTLHIGLAHFAPEQKPIGANKPPYSYLDDRIATACYGDEVKDECRVPKTTRDNILQTGLFLSLPFYSSPGYSTPPQSPENKMHQLLKTVRTVRSSISHSISRLLKRRRTPLSSGSFDRNVRVRGAFNPDIREYNPESLVQSVAVDYDSHQMHSTFEGAPEPRSPELIRVASFQSNDKTLKNASMEDIFNAIEAGTCSCNKEEIEKLAHNLLSHVKKESPDDDINKRYFATSKYILIKPIQRRSGCTTELDEETRKKYIMRFSQALFATLNALGEGVKSGLQEFGIETFQRNIVEHMVKIRMKTGVLSWSKESTHLSVNDVIAIRETAGGLSTNQIVATMSCISKLTGIQNLAPTRLKKKIGDVERDLLPTSVEIVEAQVDEKKSKSCVFYYIEQIPRLFELLIIASLRDGTFEDSFNFSSYVNKILFFRGTDRGNGDTIDMIRLGNRKNGNYGKYSVPTSILEEGAETYTNLEATCFRKELNGTFDTIDEGRVYCVTVGTSNSKVKGSTLAQCILITFKFEDFPMCELKVKYTGHSQLDDRHYASFCEHASAAGDKERKIPDELRLTESMQKDGTVELNVELLVREIESGEGNEQCHSVIGLRLYHSDELSHQIQYASPVEMTDMDSVKATIMNIHLMHTNDAKMNNTMVGLSSCSVTHPCPYCIWEKGNSHLPNWADPYCTHIMSQWQPEWGSDDDKKTLQAKLKFVDDDLRVGKHSITNDSKQYMMDTGGKNKEYSTAKGETVIDKKVRDYQTVFQLPLYVISKE